MFVSKVMKLPSAVPDISHVTYLMFFIVQYVAFFILRKNAELKEIRSIYALYPTRSIRKGDVLLFQRTRSK